MHRFRDYTEEQWSNLSDNRTIQMLREALGLPPIKSILAICKTCREEFVSQMKGSVQQLHRCNKCIYISSRSHTGLDEHDLGR
jgi:hypothetical protein